MENSLAVMWVDYSSIHNRYNIDMTLMILQTYTGSIFLSKLTIYWKDGTYNLVHMSHTVYVTLIPWWRHQMGTFSALLAICAGHSPVTGEFPAHSPVTRSMFVLICAWINGSVNNGEAGDFETPSRPLWRHCNVDYLTHTFLYVTTWYRISLQNIMLVTLAVLPE